MHLSRIEPTVVENQSIWRKDAIGTAGRILGREHHIHFEICLNAAELQKLLGAGRPLTWRDPATAPTADGRTDSVFGSVYVYLPAGTPTSAAAPVSHLRGGAVAGTLQEAQWVEIRYRNGSAKVSSYRATEGADGSPVGTPIGQSHPEPDFEYNLYAEANRRHTGLGAAVQATSSPSGWYELLRFGRNLGPDPLPGNAAHWRQIPTASGTVWADLNAPGTFKFSDADFPAFLGWQCYDDDPSADNQRCDSLQLKRAIRDPQVPESIRQRAVLARRLGDAGVRSTFKRAICKFPTEWDRSTIAKRYEWLKTDDEYRVEPGKGWEEFEAHCKAITFDDLPEEYKAATWHLHPRTFISHMRMCGWLSEKEARQLFPKSALRNAGAKGWVTEGVNPGNQLLRDNLTNLNKTTRKYCITTPGRMAAFYGNAMQETQWFTLLIENGGPSTRYAPWHGRGFLQLTWPSNYIKYARFRGALVDPRLEAQLAAAQKTADTTRTNAALSALESQVPSELINFRNFAESRNQRIEPSDSAGVYWAWSMASRSADHSAPFCRAVVSSVGKAMVYYTHSSFGNVAATVNVGHPSSNYASIYGIQARFQAYTAAAVTLMDLTEFPNSQGQMQETPEGWTRRLT